MKRWEDVKQEITIFTDEENDEMDFMVDLISTIISRRNELGISQRELARLTGIKQPAIARIESLRITPKIDTLYKLLKPLKLKLRLIKEG
ncbi:helix-turn-helix domain-containing protein [Clostridium novyi]|uniref:helix-turn-helix domain-containing protein n=1 Tax=Clostridium novyi TaxID=1542 RepID=UPI0004D4391D|nr:helix-turn-helix domain-containing protein [Clostridium novyi]KEH91611.1 hypothetical protein Z964_08875 [Clostridium novyi A str. GD211209]